jgi:carbon starvation protein CstA
MNYMGIHPQGLGLIPIFFITVACGIVSGFHATQTAIISRSVRNEKEGRTTFYNMMILEGFIAMTWAAAAMGIMASGQADAATAPTTVVGMVARDMLGSVGGTIAILGVIVLPVTSGDTALRGLRLMVADYFHIDQKSAKNRVLLSAVLFVVVAAVLVWAKFATGGFNILWRYFAWSNQTIAIFAFACISIYLGGRGYKYAPLMALIPGAFYTFITVSFIMNAAIGFNLPMTVAFIIGAAAAVAFFVASLIAGRRLHASKAPIEVAPVYA